MAEKTYCETCNRIFTNEDALAMHNSAKHFKKETPKNRKKIFIWIFIIVILISGYFLISGKPLTGNSINEDSENSVQKITLSFKNYNYYPNTIKVKQGIPVEITLDNTINGCFRSFNINGLGVSVYSSNPSKTVKFTPDKKGSFEFACGMRMGYGTIVVE